MNVFMLSEIYFFPDINQIWSLSTDFRKVPNIRFRENTFIGDELIQTDKRAEERTEVTDLESNWCFSLLMLTLIKIKGCHGFRLKIFH